MVACVYRLHCVTETMHLIGLGQPSSHHGSWECTVLNEEYACFVTRRTRSCCCRERILKEYEKLDEHERPFQQPAERDHLSDDDDEATEQVQKPAHIGASREEAHTEFEPKLRKHLRSRRHRDRASPERGSSHKSGSSHEYTRCKVCGSTVGQDRDHPDEPHTTRDIQSSLDPQTSQPYRPDSQQQADSSNSNNLNAVQQEAPGIGQWGYVGERSHGGGDKQGSKKV